MADSRRRAREAGSLRPRPQLFQGISGVLAHLRRLSPSSGSIISLFKQTSISHFYHTFLLFLTLFFSLLSAPFTVFEISIILASHFRSGLLPAPPAGKMSGAPLFTRLSLPEGLEEVVEGLAREVIKSQVSEPFDIYNFAWKHFSDLVSRKKDLPAKGKYPLSASLGKHSRGHTSIYTYMYVCAYVSLY